MRPSPKQTLMPRQSPIHSDDRPVSLFLRSATPLGLDRDRGCHTVCPNLRAKQTKRRCKACRCLVSAHASGAEAHMDWVTVWDIQAQTGGNMGWRRGLKGPAGFSAAGGDKTCLPRRTVEAFGGGNTTRRWLQQEPADEQLRKRAVNMLDIRNKLKVVDFENIATGATRRMLVRFDALLFCGGGFFGLTFFWRRPLYLGTVFRHVERGWPYPVFIDSGDTSRVST